MFVLLYYTTLKVRGKNGWKLSIASYVTIFTIKETLTRACKSHHQNLQNYPAP